MAHFITLSVLGWLRRLSYPRLFMLTAVLFACNLLIPDPLPFVDELLLGLVALLLAGRKRRASASEPAAVTGATSPR